MSIYTRLCLALTGICFGLVVLMAMDMLFISGRFVAHALHDRAPNCSIGCHG